MAVLAEGAEGGRSSGACLSRSRSGELFDSIDASISQKPGLRSPPLGVRRQSRPASGRYARLSGTAARITSFDRPEGESDRLEFGRFLCPRTRQDDAGGGPICNHAWNPFRRPSESKSCLEI